GAAGVRPARQDHWRDGDCTGFVTEGDDLDAVTIEAELERLGDSLLVVGDRTALKVHVHTDEPGAALSVGIAAGTIEAVEIANMHRQTEQREEGIVHAVPDAQETMAVVAVSVGSGEERVFTCLDSTDVECGGTGIYSDGS